MTTQPGMFISEIYQSRQGEGRLTGQSSIFLRTSGCNLRCWFCDTPYTSWNPEGNTMSLDEICDRVAKFSARHVVVTGGEPMLPRHIVPLTQRLSQLGFHITIETAGTVFRRVACDLMSISPKLSNSAPSLERAGEWRRRHENSRNRPDVVRRLMNEFDYQLKFVVDRPGDVADVTEYVAQLPDIKSDKVLLMPQGTTTDELDHQASWLIPLCRQHGFQYCPRKHIEWYGNRRGT